MTATNPAEAIARFVEQARSTAGCISQVPLVAQPAESDTYHIIFHGGRPVELQTAHGFPTLKLSVVHHCHPVPHPGIAGAYSVRSTYYAYEILDFDEAEIITYHWHPAGVSNITRPHLHLSSRIGPVPAASLGHSPVDVRLSDMHILTGRVLLEDVVRLLITEFRVNPLRDNWDETLTENRSAIQYE